MPNWCMNEMTISHNDPAMIKKAAEAWNEGKFLSTLVPEPNYPGYEDSEIKGGDFPGMPAWWTWRINNWGTKWDVGLTAELDNRAEIEDNTFTVEFDSAWSPPINAYDTLCEAGFHIRASYYEPGCAFVGDYSDGVDDCYEIIDIEQAKEEIPPYLLNKWDVIETLQNYDE